MNADKNHHQPYQKKRKPVLLSLFIKPSLIRPTLASGRNKCSLLLDEGVRALLYTKSTFIYKERKDRNEDEVVLTGNLYWEFIDNRDAMFMISIDTIAKIKGSAPGGRRFTDTPIDGGCEENIFSADAAEVVLYGKDLVKKTAWCNTDKITSHSLPELISLLQTWYSSRCNACKFQSLHLSGEISKQKLVNQLCRQLDENTDPLTIRLFA